MAIRASLGPRKDRGLTALIMAAGSLKSIAAVLGIKPQAVAKWSRIPIDRVSDLEVAFGVPREVQRPDIHNK